ncbi:hypothetical protein SCLCIDRAFT_276388 [Scleroderma citrinum Foug A]|uniref:Uncharacterized protein n=1 Tax=Scleroderma citrinum Foug A TaxID=1036808 RepID=A0A0C3D534_9AGAM|nr:hypothetical protein SCLCIDRAFT_276388 [Scleroderma citrinum Foug A]
MGCKWAQSPIEREICRSEEGHTNHPTLKCFLSANAILPPMEGHTKFMCILFAVPPFFPLWHRLIRHPSKVHLERLGAHRLEVMSMYRFSSRPRSPRFILGGASSLSSSSHTREWLHSTVALLP